MINKRFLVPVLALVAFGLPAGASTVPYCDGGGCSANTTAAFNTAVTSDDLIYASATDLRFTGILSGGTGYTDGTTGVSFLDTNGFSITGSDGLQASGSSDTITITVPAQYSALQLSLVAQNTGSFYTCLDSNCNTYAYVTGTAQFVDFIDDTPGSTWFVTISSQYASDKLIISAFDPAGAAQMGDSDTPEVGTLLLIGAGLISMRWMRRAQVRWFHSPQTA